MTDQLLFAYGSLVAVPAGATARPAVLRGFRRRWDVAMDNRVAIPGYKVYVDPESGAQPPVYVTFLAVGPDGGGGRVGGVVFPVGVDELAVLDRRERNYERVDVSDLVDGLVDGALGARVWAYAGREDARERYRAGAADGSAVVARAYVESVRAGFAARGLLDEFEASTAPLAVPVAELRRVDLAP